jgi:starch phosphorylase
VLADYQDYVDCQDKVSLLWRDPRTWTRQSILTVARSGRFSSDRAIREYCDQIWKVRSVPVEGYQPETEPASPGASTGQTSQLRYRA